MAGPMDLQTVVALGLSDESGIMSAAMVTVAL